jgi:hypothetical protein
LTDLTEARPLIRTTLNVKTFDGGKRISGLVDRATTLDVMSVDFVRRFSMSTRKSKTKTPIRLANGQCVTSSTVCDYRRLERRKNDHTILSSTLICARTTHTKINDVAVISKTLLGPLDLLSDGHNSI